MKRIVVALGGNALQKPEEPPTAENQLKNAEITAGHLAKIIAGGYQVAITHGNGPQIGRIMLQNEAAKDITPPMPMDVCGAMSQGMIGYHIQQSLGKKLLEIGMYKPVATVITQVVVDEKDKAFENPTKPVGPFYTEKEAKRLQKEKGYIMKEDANRGWRRVVPSPIPMEIAEIEVIKRLLDSDVVVIAVGGGGIPVIKDEKGNLKGVEAVIDKDYASTKLAQDLDADLLMILTAVDGVCINFGKPNERKLGRVTTTELEEYKKEGHFASGSMLPKVDAAIEFVKSKRGRKAIITSLEKAIQGLEGEVGTVITEEGYDEGICCCRCANSG